MYILLIIIYYLYFIKYTQSDYASNVKDQWFPIFHLTLFMSFIYQWCYTGT